MIQTLRPSFAHRTIRAAAAVALGTLAACAGGPATHDARESAELLQSSLPVAAAALAAGQPDVARRLYLSLAERFEEAPEPRLGLAYIAFHRGELPAAESRFVEAAERAQGRDAARAEALLGAGRAALARKRTGPARRHFEHARESARDTPSAPWIANGLAVAAALEGDYPGAGSHYAEALRTSSENPRIAANFVRMLVAAGRTDEAGRTLAARPASYWADGDDHALGRLIEDARRAAALRGEGRSPSGSALDLTCAGLGRTGARTLIDGKRPLPLRNPELEAQFALRRSLFGAPSGPSEEGVASYPELSAPTTSGAFVLRLGAWSGPRAPLPSVRCTTSRELGSPGPVPPEDEATAPPPPASSAGGDDATLPPLPAPDAVPDEGEDHAAPATLTLSLGQSRRFRLEDPATALVVAAPEVADVQLSSPTVLHIIARGVGRTTVSVHSGDRAEEQVVLVVLDLEPLRRALAEAPGLDAVQARHLPRGLVLSGEVASAEAGARALRVAVASLPEDVPIENDLRVATPQQVNLEVQIAEVSRAVTEDLGVNWEAFGIKNAERFGFRIGRFLPLGPGGDLALDAFPPTLAAGDTASTIFFGSQGPRGQFRAMIDALATAGLANVLARPNVTAVSGESASFFSGGEFPLPTGIKDGAIVFEYKKYGVLLDFVPTVIEAGRIVLTVRPEVSEPSRNQSVEVAAGVSVPVINVRRAETTVEVGDGESIVIAGLFRNTSNTVETGITGLKDVPLFGALFGKTSIRSDELELIVIVTARLVHAGIASEEGEAPPAYRRIGGYYY